MYNSIDTLENSMVVFKLLNKLCNPVIDYSTLLGVTPTIKYNHTKTWPWVYISNIYDRSEEEAKPKCLSTMNGEPKRNCHTLDFCSAINRSKVRHMFQQGWAPSLLKWKSHVMSGYIYTNCPEQANPCSRSLMTGTGPGGRDGGDNSFKTQYTQKSMDKLYNIKRGVSCYLDYTLKMKRLNLQN